MSQDPSLDTDRAVIDELCQLEDEEFVIAAYQHILRRAPDAGGLVHYLEQVRCGERKTRIIEELAFSNEGRLLASDPEQLRMYRDPTARSWRGFFRRVGGDQFERIERDIRVLNNLNYRLNKAVLVQERLLQDVLSLVFDISARVVEIADTLQTTTEMGSKSSVAGTRSLARTLGELQSAIVSLRES